MNRCAATINPPRVMAISRGPEVVVPPAWHADHTPPSHSVHLPDCPYAVGSCSQHACYSQELGRWAKSSFASPPAETISLKIAAQSVVATKAPYLNICEGKKDIDALITTEGLVTITLKMIIPKVYLGSPHPWHINEFVVHDTEWVDLGAHHSPLPYYYSQCLQPAQKNSTIYTFKTKQFALYVVVPAAQWAEYEAFIEPGTQPVDSGPLTSLTAGSLSFPERDLPSHTSVREAPIPSRPLVSHYALSTYMPTCIGIPPMQPNQGESTT
ncbi:hypothetical protein SCLCIDRAFT_123653 [Scleroderma citrinum Foug A]|uniref:Uncharacterized protein n=1 Tax=Scleroderma citrinum Foug A TaxID=1036808 RepID=A0A0C3DXT9_9AGAM|nr:hypothetical protein SCLCIDRAFT_123653 [Scleroderma citrinum Foug A]